jgi:hypothetical protein
MHIDPIHAGPVALAHALALASRAATQSGNSEPTQALDGMSRRHRFQPLQRLARWWHEQDATQGPSPDPMQLVMWSECVGRPYLTALTGLLVVDRLRKIEKAAGKRYSTGSGPVR